MPAKLLSQSSSSSSTRASLSSSPLAIFPSLWLSMSTACSSSYGRSRTCLAAVLPKWSWCRIHSLVTLWAQAPYTLYSQDCCSLLLHILPVTDHRCIQCFSAVTILSCTPFVFIMTTIIIEIQAQECATQVSFISTMGRLFFLNNFCACADHSGLEFKPSLEYVPSVIAYHWGLQSVDFHQFFDCFPVW